MKKILLVPLFLLIFASCGVAQMNKDVIQLDDPVSGEKIMASDMVNRGMIILFWSLAEQDCRSVCSSFQRFYLKNNKKGFLIFSIHSAKAPEQFLWSYARQYRVKFPIYKGYKRYAGGMTPKANPGLVIYNTKGKVVYNGELREGYKFAARLIKTEPCWVLGRHYKYLKYYEKKIARAVGYGKGLGYYYKKIQKMQKDRREERRKEAEHMLGRLNAYMVMLRTQLVKLQKEDPQEYLARYKRFKKLFSGLEFAKDVDKTYRSVIKSDDFRNLYKASKLWQQLEESIFKLKPARYGEDINLRDPKCLKKNISTLRKMSYIFAELKKSKYAATQYAKKAAKLAGSYDLGFK